MKNTENDTLLCKLEQCNKRFSKREAHLKRLLQAIRNVSRLIVTETDPKRLIELVCLNLTEKLDYYSAWIVLVDDADGSLTLTGASGFDDQEFKLMCELFERGEFPNCINSVLKQEETLVIEDLSVECRECPLLHEYTDSARLLHRLICNGHLYGVLNVSVPAIYAHDDDEQVILRELADNLAFALHKIETAKALHFAFDVIDSSPVVAFIWENAEGWPVRYVSEKVTSLFGYTTEDFISGVVSYSQVIHPEDLERVGREVASSSADLTSDTVEHTPYRIITRSGEIKWIEDLTKIQRSGDGQVETYQGILLDITERKQAEVALLERVKELQCLHGIAAAIRKQSPSDIFEEIATLIPPAWHYPAITRCRINFDDREYVSEPFNESPWKLSADIVVDGSRRGSIDVFYMEERPELDDGPFLKEECKLLHTITDNVSESLDRMQVEERMHEMAIRYREIFESSQDAIMTLAPPTWRFSSGNSAAFKLFGVGSEEEFVTKGPWDVSPEYQSDGTLSAEAAEKNIRTAMRDGVLFFEWTHQTLAGKEFPSSVLLTRIVLDDEELLQATVRDITERKHTEADLRHAHDDLKLILEKSPFGVVLIGKDRKIRWANGAVVKMAGVQDIKELMGQQCGEYLCPAEQKKCPILDLGESLDNSERTLRRKDGTEIPIIKTVIEIQLGGEDVLLETFVDISDRKKSENELLRIRAAVDSAAEGIVIMDPDGLPFYINKSFAFITGYNLEQKGSFTVTSVFPDAQKLIEVLESSRKNKSWTGEITLKAKNDNLVPVLLRVSFIEDENRKPEGFVFVVTDLTEKKEEDRKRAIIEAELRQAQKLESVGQLAAGIAHEINTPIQFVSDNLRFLQDSFGDLLALSNRHIEWIAAARKNAITDIMIAEQERAVEAVDIEELKEELPLAISQSLEGTNRVATIVRAMKEFSHPGSAEMANADINEAIETTITVTRNEWKYVAEMKTDLAPDLPQVPCLLGEFNQVILNMIVNARDAIQEKVSASSDKESGSGQGLAIAHSLIVKKHKGELTFETEEGKGTTFIIRIPLLARS